jgi:NhaA family Na+:H+ antiporter
LLAIADDAIGLIILAVFYPSAALSFTSLIGLMAGALLLALWLKRRHTHSFWLYVLGPGALVVGGSLLGRIPPCAGARPNRAVHAAQSSRPGIFDAREDRLPDTLNRFEHWWATPVQLILMLFGFRECGVPFVQIGPGTYYRSRGACWWGNRWRLRALDGWPSLRRASSQRCANG